MVINNLDISGLAADPFETDTPLVIDADAILACSISPELLESVAGNGRQVLQIFCAIEVKQFAASSALDIRRQISRNLPVENLFGFFRRKSLDHALMISLRDNIVKFS
jgi:hypothetical protein